jgi:hypothetical protein
VFISYELRSLAASDTSSNLPCVMCNSLHSFIYLFICLVLDLLLQGTFLPLVVPPNSQQIILWSTWLVLLCSLKVLCEGTSNIEIPLSILTDMHVTSRCSNHWPENVLSASMRHPQQLHQNIFVYILHCCLFFRLIYYGNIPWLVNMNQASYFIEINLLRRYFWRWVYLIC